MTHSSVDRSVQLMNMAKILLFAVCVMLQLTSAISSIQSDLPSFEDFNKRDVTSTAGLGSGGLRLQCQTHPRNCPGGYDLKRSGLLSAILSQESQTPYREDERVQAQAILEAAEDLKRSLRTVRNGLRYKLLELLRPSFADSSDESRDITV